MDWLPFVFGLGAVQLFLMLWGFSILNQRLQLAILSLDVKLGGAIQAEIQRIGHELASSEPPNALQGLLAQLVTKNMPQGAPLEIPRSDDGRFS